MRAFSIASVRCLSSSIPILTRALGARSRPTFCMIFADHGTAYGEDGFSGHRLSHPTVMTVPYAEAFIRPE